MLQTRKRRGKHERGQALVEFSLVAVLFFLILFGIFDMARLFESWMAVQHASREGARYAITGQISCDGVSETPGDREECIRRRAKGATVGLTGGGINGTDVTVTFRAWDYTGVSGNAWSSTTTTGEPGKECDQLEVRVAYKHHFLTPIVQAFAPGGIQIYGSQRMTNEPFQVCVPNDTAAYP